VTDLDAGGPMVGPARRRVLADEVADTIRDVIFAGRTDLGQRLVEEELASMLNVSRGPVREALVLLSQEGLVHTERHRGAAVEAQRRTLVRG
jgi:DNA-binding GntR family transcriptional regulator